MFLRLGCSSKIAAKYLEVREKSRNQCYFEPGKVESLKKRFLKLTSSIGYGGMRPFPK